jgi:hypothetical protein
MKGIGNGCPVVELDELLELDEEEELELLDEAEDELLLELLEEDKLLLLEAEDELLLELLELLEDKELKLDNEELLLEGKAIELALAERELSKLITEIEPALVEGVNAAEKLL